MTDGATKTEIRGRSLALRRALAPEERQRLSELTCRELFGWLKAVECHEVAGYASLADEVSTKPLLKALWEANRSVALPRVTLEGSSITAGVLELWLIRSPDELTPGHFGILEPSADVRSQPSRRVTPESLDAIVVPGAAFDTFGGRIGFGRGHYDRLLEHVPQTTPRIGLCFDCQIFKRLPQERHDVPMTHLATLSGVNPCTSDPA